jgi:uncharacterized protein YfaS (alpha-2-macroglobulin family)
MSTNELVMQTETRQQNLRLFSWIFVGLLLTLVALLAVSLEKPTGSISGRVSLEQKGFHTQSYNFKEHRAYALVNGPRQGAIERGVFINQDGTFALANLPVGEYHLKVRAKGFATYEQSGVFVDEGKTTKLRQDIAMTILQPSVSLGQHARVFSSKEQPVIFANTIGADTGSLKVYRTDIIPFSKSATAKKMLLFGNDMAMSKNSEAKFVNPCKDQKPTCTQTFKLEQDSSDSARAVLDLPSGLPAGDYVAYAQVNGLNGISDDISWFSVSDVGLIIKRDSDKVIARAVDLNTFKPVKDCAISMLDGESKEALSKPVLTKADGTATMSLDDSNPIWHKKAQDLDLPSAEFLFVGAIKDQRAYGNISQSTFSNDAYQTYFYTDKSVYRLGQTVSYKGICRQKTSKGLENPGANIKIEATIEDPENNEIWKGTVITNAHGTFHGSFAIPEDGKTGGYQFIAKYPDESQDYGSFEVAEYRKPEYQVEMTPLTPRVNGGDQAKVRLKANYYFGAPVAHAKIKYSIYTGTDWASHLAFEPRPDYYDFFDSWNDNYNDSAEGEMQEEGVAETDDNGEAIITFVTKVKGPITGGPNSSDLADIRYTVKTEVTDISRLTVEGSTSLSCVSGDFMLFVEPDSSILKIGEKMKVAVTAENYDHKMLPNQPVKVTVRRYVYDSVKYTYREEPTVGEETASTDANGKATVSFDVGNQLVSDQYFITAQAQDAEKHQIFAQNSVWIANTDYPYSKSEADAETEPLTIRTDKDIYKPGDVAKVMITAPLTGKEGIDAIVTVEGMRIYDYKIVNMNATARTFEIPITAEYAPNVFFDVAIVGKKHQFYSGEQMIKVSPDQNFLKIAIATNKDRYKPGDTANYTITAKHEDGTPAVDAELSLAVIDESVYAIRGEQAPDIRRFYYSRRDNVVVTANSFPMMYTGGPDKIEPRVRRNFKDTAAWIPELVTDKTGTAKASFKLPDNLTTWRATVRGIDMKTDVGSAVQKVIATQDFILRLALPRFFSQGDQGILTAIVHNYTKQEQTVKLALTTSSQFDIKTNKNQELKIAADKAARYSWPVTITSSGTGTIKATAIGQTAGDAMESHLPIRPLGIPAFAFKSGVMLDDKQTVDLPMGLSADADKATFKGKLTMSSSTIGPVLGNFDKLIDYPYGCTEQTMSKLIPSVVAMQLHKKLNIPISDANAKRFADSQKKSLEKLLGYHHQDGGWGWWADDESSAYLTPYIVQGLSLLKISDIKVDDSLISSGLHWIATSAIELKKQMADPHHKYDPYFDTELRTDLARLLYTLSLWNATPESLLQPTAHSVAKQSKTTTMQLGADILGPVKAVNAPGAPANQSAVRDWLVTQTPNLPPEALSYLTLTCKKFNANKDAEKTYARLTELANTVDATNWDHTQALANKMNSKYTGLEYDYRFTGTETTALAFKAVLTMEADNLEKIESIKQWLLLQRDDNGWSNTKTTSEVFLVLLQEELQSLSKRPTDFTVRAKVGSNQLFQTAYNSINTYTPESVTDIPLNLADLHADLHNERAHASDDKSGAAEAHPLSITKDGSGRLYYSTLFTYFRKLLANDQSVEKGLPQGLKLTRKFYRMKPVATTTNGAIHMRSEEITDGHVKAGETIMMRMFVEAPVRLPYIKLEAALPSGAEVVKENSDDTEAAKTLEGDWSAPWWTHQDILDDRIVYFGRSVPAGKSEFYTMLRMELPGSIQINPVSLEGMYSDKVRAYSSLGSLQISD